MSQEQTQPNPTPPTSGKQISPDKEKIQEK
jgi:hypothetical protein